MIFPSVCLEAERPTLSGGGSTTTHLLTGTAELQRTAGSPVRCSVLFGLVFSICSSTRYRNLVGCGFIARLFSGLTNSLDQGRQMRLQPLLIVAREQPDSPMTKLLTASANLHFVHRGTPEQKVDHSPQEHFPPLGILGVDARRHLGHWQS